MINEQEIITKLLSTVESIIEMDNFRELLSNEDLEEYCISAIYANKKFGRTCSPSVERVVNSMEGLSIPALDSAGLSYEDYRRAIYPYSTKP